MNGLGGDREMSVTSFDRFRPEPGWTKPRRFTYKKYLGVASFTEVRTTFGGEPDMDL